MNKSKFLYLPIEVKPRELDAKLLIAAEACRKGYSVIIGTKALNSLLPQGPKGIYFYKDASAPLVERFKHINSLGHKIAIHDEEGLVQQSDDDYLKRRVMFETIKYVQMFFCWGAHQAGLISQVKQAFMSDVAINVTGHPRFDLLRAPLRYYNAAQKSLNGKTILINTKLAECNHQRGENGWLDLLKSHNMLHSDSCLPLRLDQIEYKKSLFNHYKELVKQLSARYPDDKIIIRPHPSESITGWQDLAAPLQNVVVTKQHNIGYWLNRSDVVIHTGCTTAIEAYAAGLPVITFKPVHDERFEIALPNQVSLVAQSTEQCALLVGQLLGDAAEYLSHDEEFTRILKPHIENISGDFSYKMIVEALNQLDIQPQSLTMACRMKWKLRDILSSFKQQLTGKTASQRDISAGEVEDALNKLCAAAQITQPKISRLKNNIYLLESN
ncbi:surface carbohydrate biosynthesis protein [Bermanella sp. R86510]|uniref:surface carbohydrate biosynthesis protein n=1 Tax=unclassified Bermanella TaxID=2627862 RepID=UPI0037CC13D9